MLSSSDCPAYHSLDLSASCVLRGYLIQSLPFAHKSEDLGSHFTGGLCIKEIFLFLIFLILLCYYSPMPQLEQLLRSRNLFGYGSGGGRKSKIQEAVSGKTPLAQSPHGRRWQVKGGRLD